MELTELESWMEGKGLSQKELAAAVGVHESAVSLFLRGKRPVTDGFRWKFAMRWGWSLAMQFLGTGEESNVDRHAATGEHGG